MRNLLITGGAGFIGSNFVHYMLERYSDYRIVVFDKLTYAGRRENLLRWEGEPRFAFVQGDICDLAAVRSVVQTHEIDTIVNFAAETHVDRSILAPDAVVTTNVNGTWALLEVARELQLERFHQISTDEVYGAIPPPQRSREGDPLEPRSPYSASKAGAEHLVYAYYITYGLPVTTTRGSNNIGPYHYPEKAVPLFTTNALDDLPLPIYGDGLQMRDYQYVLDHCEGIDLVLHKGQLGEFYNVGTEVETTNIVMARKILDILGKPHSLITHVTDRAGHDRRYALDCSKLRALGWQSRHSFDEALERTVRWFVANEAWWRPLKSGEYLEYYRKQYGER
ncbi:dTDP-glucose 4,6-dehydratase [Candidatus Viridilinea mediisalina]|uniref:dTDP-glucose 4,6-dehydratase n=1 Tax=Candidatus Viridilinea mediisalina TaxID=2024553 RepID=A0A2A6RJK7_9CHLR|nr:dTDP-glucose 4,6-dehydratase [Candidatus Viridilinea mediisalina]PDW03030.1 dTDP-glucose 4,6-dehydratase [Candidatus Viridilinea mediisalina]